MTAQRQLKLGAITMGTGGPGAHYQWLDPEIPGDASVSVSWYIEQARLAEAAKFDLIFIVDSQFITADSPPHYLNRLEPMTLLPALAVTTTHLGLVATMTTSYNDPFNVARRLASLDLISAGRSGWNVVTSGDAGAAANFSRAEHFDYDTRYARGLEFVRVAQGLWDSYEAEAFPRDRTTRTFLDPARQHALNHHGDHFQVAGPLNIERSPQGQPVIFQAGDSDQGRDLGAEIGEGIFTFAASIEQAQAFYTDIKSRAIARGREPDHIVVMPGVRVFVGDTDKEARAIEREIQLTDQDFDKALAELGRPFAWHDFRQYDLDAPFPDVLHVAERGFRTQAEHIVQLARDNSFTLRQTVQFISSPKPTPFAGSAETVAAEIQRWFEGRALDGLNIHIGRPSQWRRFLTEVVPILQDRGIFRTDYESTTLRGNLGLPVPENRYARFGQAVSSGARKLSSLGAAMTAITERTPVVSWTEPDGIAPRGTLIVLPGRGEQPELYERFGRRIASDGYRVHVVADPVQDVALATAQVLSQAVLVHPYVLAGSDTGALFAAGLVASGQVPEVDALILAGLPVVAEAGSAELASWDAELDMRTACPAHRGRLAGPMLRRGALQEPVPDRWASLADLEQVAQPVLCVHGADDPISPLTAARARYAAAPRAQLVSIAGGRHDALNDISHRTVAALIVLFLERLRLGADLPLIATSENP